MRDYLNAICKYPLLTTDQEIKLSRRVKRWQELRDKPNLTNAERREIRSGLRAREELVKCKVGFSFAFYFVFSYMREQVCVAVCPYGRLQGVLLDKNASAVR